MKMSTNIMRKQSHRERDKLKDKPWLNKSLIKSIMRKLLKTEGKRRKQESKQMEMKVSILTMSTMNTAQKVVAKSKLEEVNLTTEFLRKLEQVVAAVVVQVWKSK